jgi:two-component system nitrate/nitrite response regulator NarL
MEIKKIWLADDHQLVIDGYKLLIAMRDDLYVQGVSFSGLELLKSIAINPVDLIISDLKMPGMDGINLMQELKKQFPNIPVLVVSMSDEIEIIYRLFLTEIEGYILKNTNKEEFFLAIDYLLHGKIYYQKELLEQIVLKQQKQMQNLKQSKSVLSDRELEVLQLILKEFTSKQIAEMLHISKQTVDTHRINIYEKTGTKTIVGLIKYAISQHLL